jgi:hypothetical protein
VDTALQNIELQVDGQPLALKVTKMDMLDYLTIQSGYGWRLCRDQGCAKNSAISISRTQE